MNTNALEKHMIDTVKEWQMKIGFRSEEMNLYYPDISLAGLLELPKDLTEEKLKAALEEFAQETEERLGRIRVSNNGERYCLTIPAEGCTYIHTQVPDSEFLKVFLETVTAPGAGLEQVYTCFEQNARENGECFVSADREQEGLGHVFYFAGKRSGEAGTSVPEGADADPAQSDIDEYVYCVESDDFGLTYHRFSWPDYQKLISENQEVKHQAETCVMCQ